jgi:uncharacterized protein YegJ (DUF2314 family)
MENVENKEEIKFNKNRIATWFVEDKGISYNADTLYILKK